MVEKLVSYKASFQISLLLTSYLLFDRLYAQNVQLQQLIKNNKNFDQKITDLKNTCQKIQSLLEVVLGMKENEYETIQYEINNDEVPVIQ